MTGDINKHLHACLKKAGIFYGKSIPKNLCCNIIRKSASTGIRKNQPTKFQEVSETMCHSTEIIGSVMYLSIQSEVEPTL